MAANSPLGPRFARENAPDSGTTYETVSGAGAWRRGRGAVPLTRQRPEGVLGAGGDGPGHPGSAGLRKARGQSGSSAYPQIRRSGVRTGSAFSQSLAGRRKTRPKSLVFGRSHEQVVRGVRVRSSLLSRTSSFAFGIGNAYSRMRRRSSWFKFSASTYR